MAAPLWIAWCPIPGTPKALARQPQCLQSPILYLHPQCRLLKACNPACAQSSCSPIHFSGTWPCYFKPSTPPVWHSVYSSGCHEGKSSAATTPVLGLCVLHAVPFKIFLLLSPWVCCHQEFLSLHLALCTSSKAFLKGYVALKKGLWWIMI